MNIARWEKTSSIIGAAAWAALCGLAGSRKAPLGVIELLFLFAPLVIVPLGMALGRRLSPLRHAGVGFCLCALQPLAAGAVVVAFWLPPGRLAGALAVPWLALAVALGIEGALTLRDDTHRTLTSWAVNVGRMDLVVAGTWLLVSRLGLRPLGIQEPIVLLTAVHFHYTGFATALLAGALVSHAEKARLSRSPLDAAALLVIAVPFIVAAGFVWSATLKLVAVFVLAASLVILAGFQFWFAGELGWPGRYLLRLSALTVVFGMVLAGVYAVGDWLGRDWLVFPRMASTHGLLNGLGFVLLGLLGWLVSTNSSS